MVRGTSETVIFSRLWQTVQRDSDYLRVVVYSLWDDAVAEPAAYVHGQVVFSVGKNMETFVTRREGSNPFFSVPKNRCRCHKMA